MRIRVAGLDPALRNVGIARMMLDLGTLELELEDLVLIQTEKMTGKVVRQNSDDLRRAVEIHRGLHAALQDCRICFAEVPSGAQNARAGLSFGMAIGILASCPIPLIEVMPVETKLAAVQSKTASKPQMISWATSLYPNGAWIRARGNPKGAFTLDNEHLADACGIVHAGIATPEFKRLLALWKANLLAA